MASLLEGQDLVDARLIFTDAFNKNRPVLAGFAKCESEEDLHIVRDGWYLGLAKGLKLAEYEPVKKHIIEDMKVAMAAGTAGGFQQTIESARASLGWNALVAAVFKEAAAVDSDLAGIWEGLETGRLDWIKATKATHMLKMNLRLALEKDNAMEGDVHDAKMVWMYALATVLPGEQIQEIAKLWAKACKIESFYEPLVGYLPEKWDPRRKEWAALDLMVQEASLRAGTTLDEAWALTTATLDVPSAVAVDLSKPTKMFKQKARKKK
jgi:hypothetical protein